MTVFDARSGAKVAVGDTIQYIDGEWWRLLSVTPGLTHAIALIEGNDIRGDEVAPGVFRQAVVMPVHYMHPAFMFQRVAFMPT